MKHWVRFYFPFSLSQHTDVKNQDTVLDVIQSLTLEELAVALALPVTQTDKFSQLDSTTTLWQTTRYKTDPRFDDHLSKILNGRKLTSEQKNTQLPLCIKLSNEGVSWLNGGKPGQLGAGLMVSLPNSSIKRLAEQQLRAPFDNERSWPVKINEVYCVVFNTGIGICVIEVAYKSPGNKPQFEIQSALEIQELNYHLARNKQNKQTLQLHWQNQSKDTGPAVIGLAGLVKAILPPLSTNSIAASLTPMHWENTYTYTVVELDDSKDDDSVRLQAFRLARKYTDAYAPSTGEFEDSEYRFFDNIVHHFAIEGCCTVIKVSKDSPEAIKQFSETACRMAYEPIVMLVYSEMVFLHAMTQGSNIDIDLQNPTEHELEELRHYRTRLYNYRLNNRFSYVSSLTLHNEFFQRLRIAFNIDTILKELSTDVQEIEAFISLHLEEKNQRSLNNVKIVGSLFATLVLLTDLTGLNLHELFFADPPIPVIMRGIFWGTLVLIVVGFAVMFGSMKNK